MPSDAERALELRQGRRGVSGRAARRVCVVGDGSLNTPGVLKVWDVATGECLATLEGHSYQDKTLKVWDVATGECVATLEGHSKGHSDGVNCVAVFPDGRRVVSASQDNTSGALPSHRTGGASFLVMGFGIAGKECSRCGTWRPANAWRR
uniref:Uncharacterized protein n=1 Tax=Pelagomonas calceolata TaxID=35677 RepID=A0A7S4EAP6_9STRA